jgi:hypothetical protein
MKVKILYDFYLDGYQNGIAFGYVPDFCGDKSIIAYTKGFEHSKAKKPKLDLFQFSKLTLGEMPTVQCDIVVV